MGFGGFSWKRALGITKLKQNVSRSIGIPLTKSGRQRKFGAMLGGSIFGAIPVSGSNDDGKRVNVNEGSSSASDIGLYKIHIPIPRPIEESIATAVCQVTALMSRVPMNEFPECRTLRRGSFQRRKLADAVRENHIFTLLAIRSDNDDEINKIIVELAEYNTLKDILDDWHDRSRRILAMAIARDRPYAAYIMPDIYGNDDFAKEIRTQAYDRWEEQQTNTEDVECVEVVVAAATQPFNQVDGVKTIEVKANGYAHRKFPTKNEEGGCVAAVTSCLAVIVIAFIIGFLFLTIFGYIVG